MPRFYFVLSLMCLLLVQSGRLIAQETSEDLTWYWAWRESTGELFAYNAAGEVNPLMDDVHTHPYGLYRIDEQSAVILLKQEEDYAAYIVTAEAIAHIAVIYTHAALLEHGVSEDGSHASIAFYVFTGASVLSLAYPYLFIWDHGYDIQLLYNRETGSVENLEFDEWDEIRASEDGRKLRFVIENYNDEEKRAYWTLYEFDVDTAELREIQTLEYEVRPDADEVRQECTPNHNGERWLCIIYLNGTVIQEAQYVIFAEDGSIREIDQNLHLLTDLQGEWYFIESEMYGRFCEDGCSATISTFEGEESAAFIIPGNLGFHLADVELITAESILLEGYRRDEYLLSTDGSLIYLGSRPCCDGIIDENSSKDGQWRVLWDDDYTTVLWNLFEQRIVLKIAEVHSFVFAEHGVYITTNGYSFIDSQAYSVPDFGLIDFITSGYLVEYSGDFSEDRLPGIYRYTREDGLTLLIQDAMDIDFSNFWGY